MGGWAVSSFSFLPAHPRTRRHFPPHPSSPFAAFPLARTTPLAFALSKALAAGAAPEDADVVFTLALAPPTLDAATGLPSHARAADVLATATFSLADLVADQADARATAIPCAAGAGFAAAVSAAGAGVAPAAVGATVADLNVTLTGWQAVSALKG